MSINLLRDNNVYLRPSEMVSGKAMELVDCREAMKKNERHRCVY
jgi:hypothetical protein